MRRNLLIVGLAAVVAAPSLAGARTYCEQRAHDRRVAGTVIGAGVGALVGNAITDSAGGAIVGGVGGAVVGNQLSRSKCYTYHSSSRSSAYRSSARADGYPASEPVCRYESRPYYNERGELIYASTQVCR